MTSNIWLTDESAELSGYLRARVGARSQAPSLVRAVTSTEDGPSSGVQLTRAAAGTVLAWLTDPLAAVDLTAEAWTAHLWAYESAIAANAALRLQVFQFTNAEAGAALLDHNPGTELGLATKDSLYTTGAATATSLNAGDRLVIKVLLDDATGENMATGHSVTFAYNGEGPRMEGDSFLVCPNTLYLAAQVPADTLVAVRLTLKDKGDDSPALEDEDLAHAIGDALVQYSKDRPRRAIANYSGDGSAYDFTLPRLWVHGFSSVLGIEHPAGEQHPVMLSREDYTVRETWLAEQPVRKLRFFAIPASGTDNICVHYTTGHRHDTLQDTVLEGDKVAFVRLAASFAALQMSAKAANASDATISADVVQHRDAEQRWRSVAKELRAFYDEHLGRKSGPKAAMATGDWDVSLSGRLGEPIFHRTRWR